MRDHRPKGSVVQWDCPAFCQNEEWYIPLNYYTHAREVDHVMKRVAGIPCPVGIVHTLVRVHDRIVVVTHIRA